ncbi:MAG: hypothetical protein OSB65_19670 [Roseibacillus sp.]|nr:hypothetical protein [Roseibacillus sp.]
MALAKQLRISIDDAGFFPATIPPDGSYGSTRSDAGIMCVHSLWWMSGDTDLLTRAWPSMNTYAEARMKADPNGEGAPFGELPADTLPEGDSTPPKFIHLMSRAINIRLLQDMAQTASQNPFEQKVLAHQNQILGKQFQLEHVTKDHKLKHTSVTACVYALRSGLLNDVQKTVVGEQLLSAVKALQGSSPLDQGPYATAHLLPVLTWLGQVDLAVKIASEYPLETGKPMAHLAISEWLISMIGGIEANQAGFRTLRIQPHIPSQEVLQFADVKYQTPNGPTHVHWKNEQDGLTVEFLVPPNTTAYVALPAPEGSKITEKDGLLKEGKFLFGQKVVGGNITFRALPGSYRLTISN